MGNFYSNLLSKNVAFGNKILAVPAASKQESAPDGETGGSSSSGKPLTGQPTLPAAQEQGAKAGAGTAGPGGSFINLCENLCADLQRRQQRRQRQHMVCVVVDQHASWPACTHLYRICDFCRRVQQQAAVVTE